MIIIDLDEGTNRSFSWNEGVPGIHFSKVGYDSNLKRIYVIRETFFFYVDLDDLDDAYNRVIPPMTNFTLTHRIYSEDLFEHEGKVQMISVIPVEIGVVISMILGYAYIEPFKFKIAAAEGGSSLFTRLG